MPSILKLSAFAGAKQRTGANQIFEQLVAVEARLLPVLLVLTLLVTSSFQLMRVVLRMILSLSNHRVVQCS
ncbi:hypothetical protein V9T40_013809 [Parthenolecanium corni]|uniref:Uncharacterized protein n=1 Tax=Parthenolecanium corni TaxID=536013 RepID=A0AAN9TDC1_9HEMI